MYRIIILFILTLALAAPDSSARLRDRTKVYFGFGISGKQIDGTRQIGSRDFDITWPYFSELVVQNNFGEPIVSMVRPMQYGYSLSSPNFYGISLVAGLKLSRHWAFTVNYEYLFSRSGFDNVAWDGGETGDLAGRTGMLGVRHTFDIHEIQTMLEAHTGWKGFYLTAGLESIIAGFRRQIDLTEDGAEPGTNLYSSDVEDRAVWSTWAFGFGQEVQLSDQFSMVATFSHSIVEYVAGTKARLTIRYWPWE